MRVAERMRRSQRTLRPDDDIRHAARAMRTAGVPALAVLDEKGRVVGVVTAEDLADIPQLSTEHVDALKDVQVFELMTTDPSTIEPDATLREAAGLMLEGGFRHLPVVDANRKLVGILSERDVRTFLGVELGEFHKASRGTEDLVESLMKPNPIALLPKTPLTEALEVFADERVGAVPVLNENETLAGMLSYVDVMTWLQGQTLAREAEASPPEAFLPP